MTRRPTAREVDIRRVLRAAKAAGWGVATVAPDGTISLSSAPPIERPSPPAGERAESNTCDGM